MALIIIGGIIEPEARILMLSNCSPSFSISISYSPSRRGVTVIKCPIIFVLKARTGGPPASLTSKIAPSTIFPVESTTCPTTTFADVGGLGGAASAAKIAAVVP